MIYIDIEVGGYYLCQIKYPYPVQKIMKNGQMIPLENKHRIRQFVIQKKPFLAKKDFTAVVTNQRVFNE